MKLVFQIIRPISLKYSLKGRNAKREENVYKVNFCFVSKGKKCTDLLCQFIPIVFNVMIISEKPIGRLTNTLRTKQHGMGLFNTLFHVRVSFAGPKIFRPRGLREKEREGVKSLISMCSQLALPVPNGYIKYPFFPRMILLFGDEDSSNCCSGPHTSGTGQYRNWPHPTLPSEISRRINLHVSQHWHLPSYCVGQDRIFI